MSWTSARAKVAALSRSRQQNDPELVSARSSLAELTPERRFNRLAKTFGQALESLAPLTGEQGATLEQLITNRKIGGGN